MKHVFVSALAAATLASAAFAQIQQVQPFAQTGDLLVGDNFGSVILRFHDGNGNGNYNDSGEIFVYFDPAVALDPLTGLPYGAARLGNPTAMAVDLQGNVYVVDASASSRTCFRLHDWNGDGDANDAGESLIFFDGTNGGGRANFSFQGVTVDGNNHVIVTTSGQGSGFTTLDRVFRLEDNNNDGDANDAGEQTLLYDRNTAAANGATVLDVPAWIGTLPDGGLYATNGFSTSQGAFRFTDTTIPNGRFDDAAETVPCYTGNGGNPAPKFTWCARFGRDGRFYLLNNTDKKLIAATDLDFNNSWDNPGEAITFAASTVGGITWGSCFGFEVRPDGAAILGDTGGSGNNRLLLYKDLNGNQDANDAGEQSVFVTFSTTPFPSAKPRSLLFLPLEPTELGAGCPTSQGSTPHLAWVRAGGIAKNGSLTFEMKATNLVPNLAAYLFYSDTTFPIPFDTLAPGFADPACILYPGIFSPEFNSFEMGYADNAGEISLVVPLNANPALAGSTFTAQVLSVDISGPPIVFSNALVVPIL